MRTADGRIELQLKQSGPARRGGKTYGIDCPRSRQLVINRKRQLHTTAKHKRAIQCDAQYKRRVYNTRPRKLKAKLKQGNARTARRHRNHGHGDQRRGSSKRSRIGGKHERGEQERDGRDIGNLVGNHGRNVGRKR